MVSCDALWALSVTAMTTENRPRSAIELYGMVSASGKFQACELNCFISLSGSDPTETKPHHSGEQKLGCSVVGFNCQTSGSGNEKLNVSVCSLLSGAAYVRMNVRAGRDKSTMGLPLTRIELSILSMLN